MEFDFVAGRPALDFIATISERGSTALERLTFPADLADWIELAELTDRRVAVSVADLQEAKKLREALFAVVTASVQGTSPTERDRRIVNAAAAPGPPTLALTREGRVARNGTIGSVLALLARDAIDLLDSPDLELVRWCADQSCSRPFVDRSRGHRRRWCGMRGCGDRSKSAAYRDRLRERQSAS